MKRIWKFDIVDYNGRVLEKDVYWGVVSVILLKDVEDMIRKVYGKSTFLRNIRLLRYSRWLNGVVREFSNKDGVILKRWYSKVDEDIDLNNGVFNVLSRYNKDLSNVHLDVTQNIYLDIEYFVYEYVDEKNNGEIKSCLLIRGNAVEYVPTLDLDTSFYFEKTSMGAYILPNYLVFAKPDNSVEYYKEEEVQNLPKFIRAKENEGYTYLGTSITPPIEISSYLDVVHLKEEVSNYQTSVILDNPKGWQIVVEHFREMWPTLQRGASEVLGIELQDNFSITEDLEKAVKGWIKEYGFEKDFLLFSIMHTSAGASYEEMYDALKVEIMNRREEMRELFFKMGVVVREVQNEENRGEETEMEM